MHTTAFPSALPKHSSEMDASIQKYLLLSGQQDSLRRRLSSARPFAASRMSSQGGMPNSFASFSASPISPLSDSPPSPTSPYPLPGASFGHGQFVPSHTSALTSTDPDDTSSDNVLYDINQAIKATLTELLNRDEVKHDETLRQWVQGRLMDTQLELRRQRRRRSSTTDGSTGSFSGPASFPRSTSTFE